MPLTNYHKEPRPWGGFERFTLNESSTVKLITVGPGQALSLQTHAKRSEFWRILSGSGTVVIDGAEHQALAGQDYFVPKGAQHRVAAGPQGLTFLEIAFGTFNEDDIVRLDDKYGRV